MLFLKKNKSKNIKMFFYTFLWILLLFAVQNYFSSVNIWGNQTIEAAEKKPRTIFGVEKMDNTVLNEKKTPRTVFDYYGKGGFMMHIILINSVIGLAIFLEKLLVLRKNKIIPTVFVQTIKQNLKMQGNTWDYKDVYRFINSSPEKNSCFAKILKAGLRANKEGLRGMKSSIENANILESREFDKRVSTLGLLANLGPLLGFLGTVTGMIKAFESMQALAATSPEIVGGGISEALITTAFGLFIGIPLLVCYYNVKGRVENILSDIDKTAVEIIELVALKGEEGFDEI